MIRKTFKTLSLLLLLGVLSGCPRGETNTLDEVLSAAKARYSSVKDAAVAADVKPKLDRLTGLLEAIPASTGSGDVGSQANEIADILVELTPKASATNRAAMAELVPQFRTYGDSKSVATVAQAKLLSSRTYSLIASELETLKFQFS